MLCHVMVCHVMLCHVVLCHVMLCHIMSCIIMTFHVMKLVSAGGHRGGGVEDPAWHGDDGGPETRGQPPHGVARGGLIQVENISIRKYFNDLHCRRGREPQMIDKLEKAITAIGNYNKRSISQNIEFINSSSSGADSERGHGGSVRDRWDGRRDLLRHSCLQTIRRLHRAAHDVLLEDAYYFLHDTNIDDDITFPR